MKTIPYMKTYTQTISKQYNLHKKCSTSSKYKIYSIFDHLNIILQTHIHWESERNSEHIE